MRTKQTNETEWLELPFAKVLAIGKRIVRGGEHGIASGIDDTPAAIRSWVDEENGLVHVELRYNSSEPTARRRVVGDITGRIGKAYQRIYSLRIPVTDTRYAPTQSRHAPAIREARRQLLQAADGMPPRMKMHLRSVAKALSERLRSLH